MRPRPNLISLVGKTFNNMKVIGFSNTKRSKLEMQCHCGKIFSTRHDWIVRNKVMSCGCFKSKHLKKLNKTHSYTKLPPQEAAINLLYNRYKKGAEKRKLEFSLDRDIFVELIKSNCVYCGKVPSQKVCSAESTGTLLYNGIDRIDNSIGYVKSNCASCCKRCNFFKGPQNGSDFLELVEIIASRCALTNQLKEHKLQNYMDRAFSVAQNSPDKETKVGSLLVKTDSGAVIADAYNGFCRGVNDSRLPNTRPHKYDYIIHSEINLIANCARHGISMDKCAVVCTLSPCKTCLRALYQCGINTVYFKEKYRDFDENINMLDLSIKTQPIGEFFKILIEPAR